ncbi:DUF1643 domain-containing protein [Dietzia maris]|uniref:DUF1643 domain-containing protein n=1 Tax=Dietzia maris TaxID=37915 RepID=UPI0037C747AA
MLTAVLLNPPSTSSGNRTRRAVQTAKRILGFADLRIVNLYSAPTRSITELNSSSCESEWLSARPAIAQALSESDAFLAAWGLGGFSGETRVCFDRQIEWVADTAAESGHGHFWMVGDQARHPSRWHQFVSDRHQRTPGGSPEERLRYVLKSHSIRTLV